MPAILTMLFSMLSGLPGILGDYFAKKQEMQEIELETQRQVMLEKQKLVNEMARADADRATAALGATGMWFKYCVFWMISFPFITCLIGWPQYANYVFHNLSVLPQWYMILYTSIVAVIWGIPVRGNIVGLTVQALKDTVSSSREYRLAKLDRKAYYKAVKDSTGQSVPQSYIDAQDKIFDKMEQEDK